MVLIAISMNVENTYICMYIIYILYITYNITYVYIYITYNYIYITYNINIYIIYILYSEGKDNYGIQQLWCFVLCT